MELIKNIDEDMPFLNNIIKKKRGRPKKIRNETEIIEKKTKTRGRPRKEKQIILIEETETNNEEINISKSKIGRPKIYNTKEEYLQSKRERSRIAYDDKGKIYLKILSFKKNYNLNLNTEELKCKSVEELTEILLLLSNKIQEIKKEKHNEYINRLKNKINELENRDDFKPKSKYLTF